MNNTMMSQNLRFHPAFRWVLVLGALSLMLMSARRVFGESTSGDQGLIQITLRSGITLDASEVGKPITLGRVADIQGDDVSQLSGMVVVQADELGTEKNLTIAQLRAVMEKSTARLNWARISLRGQACMIGTGERVQSGAVRKVPSPEKVAQAEIVDIRSTNTIRAAVARRLSELFVVSPENLRLGFEPADAEFLDEPGSGEIKGKMRRVDVQPAAGAGTARMPVNVFVYVGERLDTKRLVSVDVQLQKEVVAARGAIAKGDPITAEMVEVSTRWVSPGAKPSAAKDQVVGTVCVNRIAAAAVITQGDVASEIICKRGDLVYVHVLSGSITVKAKARALGSARDGEEVDLRLDGSKQTFRARMSGRGMAVLVN